MNKLWPKILIFPVLLAAFGLNAAAQTDKRIDEITRIYRETNEKIAETEENGEYSSTFLTELVVNKNNGSYPAVGLYRTVAKFFYTYGDREKNPYPNRLLKIELETRRAANVEKYEYLFNDREQLVFYSESKTEGETSLEKSLFFQNGVPIKSLTGEKTEGLKNAATFKKAKAVFAESRKLAGIFRNSLDY
jgi:hypothetical protein